MQVIWKHIISWVGIFTRFSIIKKCVSLLALLITSGTWQFHLKVLDMVTPNIWFGQQVQVPWSWRLQRRTGVGSLEVNNQFFALLWVQLKMLLADHCSNAFTALWIALLLPLEWSKHASISIALDSSAIDILVWSMLKLTLCEPNYKEKEVHWPTDWTDSEPRGAETEMSQLKILKKPVQTKTKQKKTLSNLIEAEITGHLRRWEGGTVRYTFFVLCIC